MSEPTITDEELAEWEYQLGIQHTVVAPSVYRSRMARIITALRAERAEVERLRAENRRPAQASQAREGASKPVDQQGRDPETIIADWISTFNEPMLSPHGYRYEAKQVLAWLRDEGWTVTRSTAGGSDTELSTAAEPVES
jgi:hypothetical protein